jgi:3-phosphoshikimate 1-carboxyvinyltransferase
MFVGDASLSRRPMRRIAKPLEQMGARVEVAAHGGLPMHVHGAELTPIIYESPTASAQVKSAILLAALCAGVDAVVREPAPSRDHTERMLAARGAQVWVNEDAVMLRATRTLAAADVDVPGDPSSAAFFAALAALADSGRLYLSDVSLNTTRAGFMTVLARMGAYVKVTETRAVGGEHLGTIAVSPVANLRGVTVEAAEVPSMIDELPMLACLAAVAEGTTEVTGAAELRVKESDRIATVVRNLRAIGADAEELPDGFRITGSYQRLAGRVETEGDHRLAMAFGVLGAVRGNRIEIDDRECVAVSYPSFWRDLAAATA